MSQTRRTKERIREVRSAIRSVLEKNHPQTVRQVFYRLVSQGVIAKTEREYKGTVVKQLTKMRLAREIPFGYIADNTRWVRKPITYLSTEVALFSTAMAYRKNILNDQDCYIEIWLEKDALAGVLYRETKVYDIPLFVNRGYASITYLYEAAKSIEEEGKTTYIYYFGDHDPSGLDIARNTLARIKEFAPNCDIHFRRVAVTEEQIQEWNLPTRPTKTSDTRSRGFKGRSVEVDAIPVETLRELARDAIEEHLDKHTLEMTRKIEEAERWEFMQFAAAMQGKSKKGPDNS